MSPSAARCQVRRRGRKPEAWSGLAGVAYLPVSVPLLRSQTERSLSYFCGRAGSGWAAGQPPGHSAAGSARGAGSGGILLCPRRPQAVLPRIGSSGFLFLLNGCEISNSFSSWLSSFEGP